MALDPVVNFFRSTIATLPLNSGTTTMVLASGDGNKLPDPSVDGAFNLVVYDPSDPFVAPEIVRCTARTSDTLTISRGQEGTSDATKAAGIAWTVELVPTAKTIQDIDSTKVNVADIVNNLTSTDTNKPLSANQGKVLQDGKVAKAGDTMTGTLTATKLIPSGNVTAGNGMYLPATNTVAFSTNGAERVRVDASGNVGVNNTSPIGRFHSTENNVTDSIPNKYAIVSQIGGASSTHGINTAFYVPSFTGSGFDTRTRTFGLYIPQIRINASSVLVGNQNGDDSGQIAGIRIDDISNTAGSSGFQWKNYGIWIKNISSNTSDARQYGLKIDSITGGGSERYGLYIAGGSKNYLEGNVGIGTTSPATKLDVSGSIRASTGILFGTDTAAANTLSDYEEGTFTPSLLLTGGSVTYSLQGGSYIKIGKLVYFNIELGLSAIASPTGSVVFENLPFVGILNNNSNSISFGSITNLANSRPDVKAVQFSNTNRIVVSIHATNAASYTQMSTSDLTSTSFFALSGSYITS